MFTVRVSLTTTPEGRGTLLERLSEEASVVPSKYDGCTFYAVSVDATNENHVLLAEEWTDKAAFEQYQQSDAFKEVLGAIGSCLAAPPDSVYYESTVVGP